MFLQLCVANSIHFLVLVNLVVYYIKSNLFNKKYIIAD